MLWLDIPKTKQSNGHHLPPICVNSQSDVHIHWFYFPLFMLKLLKPKADLYSKHARVVAISPLSTFTKSPIE